MKRVYPYLYAAVILASVSFAAWCVVDTLRCSREVNRLRPQKEQPVEFAPIPKSED